MDDLVIQGENKPQRDELGRLLPGNTANPNGRPKGTTLKEYQAEKFRSMSNEEKDQWLADIAKEVRWRMSEGNPKTDTDITSGGLPIISISPEVAAKNAISTQNEEKL